MALNKNFQKRITILDECFSSRYGTFTLDKLIEVVQEKLEVNVSRRTIQEDIKYIQQTIKNNQSQEYDFDKMPVFFPKLFEGKKKIFKYSDENFALENQLLSKSDEEQFKETLAVLSRYRNRQDFFWLDELFPRIELVFNLVHEDYNGLISYQSNRDYIGQVWVGKLYNQLVRKKVLIIEYKDFKNPVTYKRTIHPYHLKQYNDRWFLFGLEVGEKYTGITNLAVDRIVSFSETLEKIKPNTINWGDYFDDFIGVSKDSNKNSVLIKLRFSKNRIDYVKTKPIHGASQRLDKSDPEQRTIIMEVIPNRELFQLLLSFGSDVQVLEPQSVIDEMKKTTVKMNEMYN